MSIVEKTKQCAGTLQCRFKAVLRLSIVITLLCIVGILLFVEANG